MEYNKLIHGKSPIEKIVCCEIQDDLTTLYIETPEGVETLIKPNKFWILAPFQIDKGFKRLNGNLYYRWIKTYTSRDEFLQDKKSYYKKDIYYINDEKEAAMLAYGFTYFKGLRVEDVSVLAFDIESEGLSLDENSKVYIISNTFRKNDKLVRRMFSIDEYPTQADMINAWCDWVREINPSIMLGHNIFSYDIIYLDHVATMHGTSLRLGRDGSSLRISDYESSFRKDGSQSYDYKRSHVYGRELVDTMFLAYKYDVGRKYSSYGLKAIIKHEGLEIEGRQFYDAGLISNNWSFLSEREKIKAYAEQDGDDALALFDLMIPSYFYLNQSIPKSFQSLNYTATGSQINSFLVRSYLQDFLSIPKSSDVESFEGAISFAIPGVYKNVLKIDFAALYPSIMREYKIYDTYKDPNANFYKMVDYFTLDRFKNKKLAKETGDKYYRDLEQSAKVFINSAYGLLGAPGLHFNSPKNAALVTSKGRELLVKSIQWATSKDLDYWTNIFKEKTDGLSDESE